MANKQQKGRFIVISVILGSSSPRRVDLLNRLGYSVEYLVPDVDETLSEPYPPDVFVMKLAQKKMEAVFEKNPEFNFWGKIAVTADTVVAFEDEILGKPANKDEARSTLTRLSGKKHTVFTSVCFAYLAKNGDGLCETLIKKTDVFFKELSSKEIEDYISLDEPYDKAGSYAIQGSGAFMVKEIHGSYTNVMGFPLAEVKDKLEEIYYTHLKI